MKRLVGYPVLEPFYCQKVTGLYLLLKVINMDVILSFVVGIPLFLLVGTFLFDC